MLAMNAVVPMSNAAGIDSGSNTVRTRLLSEAFEALDGDIDGICAFLARAAAPKLSTEFSN
jgi:hypothetical protein